MPSEHDLDALRARFTSEMHHGVRELARLGYDASIFRRMPEQHEAVEAARRLVLADAPSYGLYKLQTLNRLDMSVEMWVLLPWYAPLFDDTVRDHADESSVERNKDRCRCPGGGRWFWGSIRSVLGAVGGHR